MRYAIGGDHGPERVLLHKGQQMKPPAAVRRGAVAPGIGTGTRRRLDAEVDRHGPVDIMEMVGAQNDLLEIALTLGAASGLANLLDRGQEEADQDGDDGDNDQ